MARNYYPLVGDLKFDQITLTYTGDNVTKAEYKFEGTVVMTLDLTYDGSDNLTDVVRSIPS